MNIQERTESINNAVKKLADFVQTNDAVKNDSAPVVVNRYTAPVTTGTTVEQTSSEPTFAAAYNAARATATPGYSAPRAVGASSGGGAGSAGVQFGAFSSRNAAQTQVNNVKNKIGVSAVIEPTGTGMFRVRANNLSEDAARNIRSRAANAGFDCYIFH